MAQCQARLLLRHHLMADVGKVYPNDVQLLRKEVEVQGDLLSQEILERKAEIDRLKLELSAIKSCLERMTPGFSEEFEKAYADARERLNPEFEQESEKGTLMPLRRRGFARGSR